MTPVIVVGVVPRSSLSKTSISTAVSSFVLAVSATASGVGITVTVTVAVDVLPLSSVIV